jgi:hypothetical protein
MTPGRPQEYSLAVAATLRHRRFALLSIRNDAMAASDISGASRAEARHESPPDAIENSKNFVDIANP